MDEFEDSVCWKEVFLPSSNYPNGLGCIVATSYQLIIVYAFPTFQPPHDSGIKELSFFPRNCHFSVKHYHSLPYKTSYPHHMGQDRQTTITRDHEAGTITKAIKPFTLLDYRGVDVAKKWP